MGGWIAMNHAIHAPERLRRLVLLGPMGLPPWRATLAVPGPVISQRLRPTDAKLEKIITRSLGDGERVNREFRPWMRIVGNTRALVGQPFHIAARDLHLIHAPTLVFLGGKDGLVGSATAAASRARNIAGCEIEVLPRRRSCHERGRAGPHQRPHRRLLAVRRPPQTQESRPAPIR